MKKKIILILALILGGAGLLVVGVFYNDHLRGIWPAIWSPPDDITKLINKAEPIENSNVNKPKNTNEAEIIPESVNTTNYPITLQPGFSIAILSGDLPGARVLAEDADGNLWVSLTGNDEIRKLIIQNGVEIARETFLSNLDGPHGLAFHPDDPHLLYFAEKDKISRVRTDGNKTIEKIVDLPTGSKHNRRTIIFGPDGKLYIGLGSTCNVCIESDARDATVHVVNADGSNMRVFATGLRNPSFLRFNPTTDELWTSGNERDLLGDDLPPDEINITRDGGFYGWPHCYGQNIQDTNFDDSQAAADICKTAIAPHIEVQAHSATLGLDFIPTGSPWPQAYEGDLIVALHGSWNRTEPTGYKLIRAKLHDDGTYESTEDFISGWLTSDGALGRPVDVLMSDSGVIYVSDDKAGVIYRITYGN